MPQSFDATKSITINAKPERVWKALTDPAEVKQYLYGTDVTTDWRQGSPITYSGIWKGQPYEDKGTIVEIDPPRLLKSSYFSPLSGKEDKPENYNIVSYALAPEGTGVRLTITQSNNPTDDARQQAETNWGMMLDQIKKLVEA
jgi:uncharacterized protein YndB with AHSA1/START domain